MEDDEFDDQAAYGQSDIDDADDMLDDQSRVDREFAETDETVGQGASEPASDDGPWNDFAAPQDDGPWNDFAQQESGPWDDFKPRRPTSAAGAFTREAARSVVPLVASLPAMGAGFKVGASLGALGGPWAPVTVPVGGFVGAGLGAMGVGWAARSAQDKILDAVGFRDKEQEQADQAAHPYAQLAGGFATDLLAFRPGRIAGSLAERALSAGAVGGLDAGTQLATTGEIDPVRLAMAAGWGAALNAPTALGRAGMRPGARFVESYAPTWAGGAPRTGDGVPMTPQHDPVVDRQEAARSQDPVTGRGQEQAPPSEQVTGVGNDVNPPERSTRDYEKRRQRLMQMESDVATVVEPGRAPPDQQAALEAQLPIRNLNRQPSTVPPMQRRAPQELPPQGEVPQGGPPVRDGGPAAEPTPAAPALRPEPVGQPRPAQDVSERIVGSAVIKDGKMFTGPIHADAYDAAVAAIGKDDGIVQASGFVTSSGRFVTREEANVIAGRGTGRLSAEQLPELNDAAPSEPSVLRMDEPVPGGAPRMDVDVSVSALVRRAQQLALEAPRAAQEGQDFQPGRFDEPTPASERQARPQAREGEIVPRDDVRAQMLEDGIPQDGTREYFQMLREADAEPSSVMARDDRPLPSDRIVEMADREVDVTPRRRPYVAPESDFTPSPREQGGDVYRGRRVLPAGRRVLQDLSEPSFKDIPVTDKQLERSAWKDLETQAQARPDVRPPAADDAREPGSVRGRDAANVTEKPASPPAPERPSTKKGYPVVDASGREVARAMSEPVARTRTNSLRFAKEAMDSVSRQLEGRKLDMNKPDDLAEYRKIIAAAVDEAKASGWTRYMPRQDKGKAHLEAPREALWMDEATAFLSGRFRGGKKYPENEFITRDALLRSDETGADLVRSQRLEEGDQRMKRGPSFENVEKVTAAGKGDEPIDAAPQRPEDQYMFTDSDGRRHPMKPVESRKLSEALRPEDFGETGGKLVRDIVASEPNVRVHTVSKTDFDDLARATFGHTRIQAMYDPNQHSIVMRENTPRDTVLHEAVHAITVRRMHDNPDVVKQVRDVMDELRARADHLPSRFENAFKNEREFIAEGMSDKNFQDELANIRISSEMARALDLPAQTKGKPTNGFQAFIAMVRKMLGLDRDQHTALEAVVRLTDIARKAPLSPARSFGRRQAPPDAVIQAGVNAVQQQGNDLLKQAKAPWLMRVRDFDKIAQAADRVFGGAEKNPIRKIQSAIERARVKGIDYANADEPLLRRGDELKTQNPKAWHDLEQLMIDESMYQRFGDLPLNRQGFKTWGPAKAWRDSKHPDLERRWNALPDEYKDYRARVYDFFEARHAKLADQTVANRLMKELGIDDPALAKRFMEGTHTEAEYQRLGSDDREREAMLDVLQNVFGMGKVEGPYTPLIRRGQYVVTGKFNVVDPNTASKRLSDDEFEFTSKQDAEDFARKQHGEARVISYHVDQTGSRYSKVTEPVTRDGKPVLDPQGQPRTYERDVSYIKGDPGTSQRWKVKVERGFMSMYDTNREAIRAEKALRDGGEFEKLDVQPRKYHPHTDAVTLASMVNENHIQRNPIYENMSPSQREVVKKLLAEHYMNMLASTRTHSSRLHRDYVPGADDNLLKNTQSYSQETGTRLARLEVNEEIEAQLKVAEKMVNENTEYSAARRAVLNEATKRLDDMKDGGFRLAAGQMNPILQRVMAWSYMARLATPAHTIQNLTQTPMIGMAEVGARHGNGAAYRGMMKAYKDIGAGRILGQGLKRTFTADRRPSTFIEDIRSRLTEPREQRALDAWVKEGSVDADAGFQMAQTIRSMDGVKLDFGGAREDNAVFRGVEAGLTKADHVLQWMEDVSRQMPRAAEAVNRATTGLVAYRLEYKRNNGDHDKAVKYANDVLNNTQFRYTDTNKPKWQRHPFARVAFQFKQFGKSVYELLGRHAGNVIRRDTDPETRKESLRALGGLFVTHTIMAGALALPFEPVRALLIGAKQAGFTDTEWDDVENGVREALTGVGNLAGFNEKDSKRMAEAFSRGLPRLLGIDLSSRLSMDNLLLFGSPRSGTDREMDTNLSAWLFNMVAGAPSSLAIQHLHGLRDVLNGEYAKGIERLMPVKIGSDIVRAGRQSIEGKVNARGRQTQEPYTPFEAATRVMGLPPAREREADALQHQVYQEGQKGRHQRSELINNWLRAQGDGAKSRAFEAAIRGGLQPRDLTAAQQREISQERRTVKGIVTDRHTRPIVERLDRVYNTDR